MPKVWEYGKGWQTIEEPTTDAPSVELPGVFEKDGEVYVVKFNKSRTRLYARRLVETTTPRLKAGYSHHVLAMKPPEEKYVNFEFKYARGAIYNLTEADRMPFEKAKHLMIRYGKCIVCGRRLKVAQSVERGIGPVCINYFKEEV